MAKRKLENKEIRNMAFQGYELMMRNIKFVTDEDLYFIKEEIEKEINNRDREDEDYNNES